jgi:hypothetical protein
MAVLILKELNVSQVMIKERLLIYNYGGKDVESVTDLPSS